jgi:predicted methyltransferase
MRVLLISIFAAMLWACSDMPGGQSGSSEADAAAIAAAVAAPTRSAENKSRDTYRHPAETLSFFGLTPSSVVVELWPGGGWYTEIIAPIVRDNGKYYAAHVDPESNVEMLRKSAESYRAMLDASPELYDQVEMTVLMPPSQLDIAPPGSVDLVVSFRSIHNWMAFGMQDDVMRAVYTALKPGGMFGVVEHRGIEGEPQDPKASTGYVSEAAMIEMAEKAGLKLQASSEINANPADTKDYPDGVWTLPPRLRLGDVDRQKYLDIGESDRFTLLFVKPAE